ncbi:MAG: hypothetical protein DRQ55_09320 [Planctomycetota bacterium]|nr:MAG: hypothetical protein DRQ55_09320 [Planctomycetota bacterium]
MTTTTPWEIPSVQAGYERDFPKVVEIPTRLVVINTVSGGGGSSVGRELQERLSPRCGVMRNFSTRTQRAAVEDMRYIFGDLAEFDAQVSENNVISFIDWLPNGCRYAVLRSEIERQRSFDVAVYENTHFGWVLKSQDPERVTNIFLVCEHEQNIADRLRQRRSETMPEVVSRTRSAIEDQRHVLEHRAELLASGKLDAVIATDELSVDQVVDEVQRVLARS